jgi:hypothetical protein
MSNSKKNIITSRKNIVSTEIAEQTVLPVETAGQTF